MRRFHKGIMIAALALALAGCAAGGFSMGSLSGSRARVYEITGSGSFDESFMTAHRAMQEEGLEIVHLDRGEGKITVRMDVIENPYHDVRTIARSLAQFEFALERRDSGALAFHILANSDGWKYADRFLDRYDRYSDFSEISGKRETVEEKSGRTDGNRVSERVISEIRTGNPVLYEGKYDFSRQEIIHIQAFLYKLGYDPGPADGTLNDKTLEAIEKFRGENEIIKKLFQAE